MVLLPNGSILMTYVVRKGYTDTADGYPRFGIEAIVSRDNGRSWDLEVHNAAGRGGQEYQRGD